MIEDDSLPSVNATAFPGMRDSVVSAFVLSVLGFSAAMYGFCVFKVRANLPMHPCQQVPRTHALFRADRPYDQSSQLRRESAHMDDSHH